MKVRNSIRLYFFLILGMLLTTQLAAQVSVNQDNSSPDPSAMLDVKSSDKGVLIPRMTSAQRNTIASPSLGLLVFDTDTESFWFRDSIAWVEIRDGNEGVLISDDCYLQTNLDANNNNTIDYWNGNDQWQSFTAEHTGYLSKVEVDFVGDLEIFDNGIFRLYQGEGTSGTLLYEMPITETWGTGLHSVIIPLSDSVFLESGLVYTLFFTDTEGFEWRFGSGYSGGRAWLSPSFDMVFKTYVSHCALSDDQTLSLSGTTLSIEDGNSVDLAGLSAGSDWGLTGNAGTDTTVNFIGTTDNMPLDFRVNNTRGLRLEYAEVGGAPAPNVIGGFSGNQVSPGITGATISGGGGGPLALINSIAADLGVIGGGIENTVTMYGLTATIGGGARNTADAEAASIGGGVNNTARGSNSTVGGGNSNVAQGVMSTVGGGAQNEIAGDYATIPGGVNNKASGDYGFAAGRNAQANHDGAFVWADNTNLVFASTAPKQFLIRATNGVGINKNDPATALDVDGTVTATAFAGDGSALTGIPDDQTLSLSGTTLSIQDGNSVDLAGIDTDTDDQTLSLSGTTLSIQDGNSVDLAGIDTDTDDQTLSLSGTTLSISGGNSVNLPGDNLGNHTATQNISLNGHLLSNDGDSEGIVIDDNGRVGIGFNGLGIFNNPLTVQGTAQFTQIGIKDAAPDGLFEVNPDNIEDNGDELVIDNNGKLGIGTRTPSAKLQAIANSGNAVLLGYNGPPSIGNIPAALKIDGSGYDAGGSVTGIEVDLTGANAGSKYAAIFSGGNVGIGTSTPVARLDIGGGNIALNGGWLSNDGGNEGVFVNTTGNVGIGTSTPVARLDIGGGNIALNGGWLSNDGGNEGVFVTTSGSVGVGTSSPVNKLTVAGQASFSNNVGIGTNAPISRLDVRESVTGPNNNGTNYVAHFQNTNTDETQEQGILHLQFDADLSGNPGNGNWIQFVEGGFSKGKIENNNTGNVQYETNGADYAESLERLDHSEEIADGEVVGVFGGRISRRTEGADWVMAVSDNAAVLGNAIYDGTEANYESVSFIGQIPVWVRGAVAKGDYIVASGLNDGVAIAISPQSITPEQGNRIVGRAWESKASEEAARVNTVVGLPESASTTMALAKRVETQQDEIATLKAQVAALQAQNATLNSQTSAFEKRFTQLEGALQEMKAESANKRSASEK